MADEQAEEQGLAERWQLRQEQLKALLAQHGATRFERDIDWQGGHIAWVAPNGEPEVVAELRALCSYDHADGSLLMAWANEGGDAGAAIAPLPNVPELIEHCAEPEAWLWAMRLAEESGAHYLYRITSPQFLVFLGLWDVRSALDEVTVKAGSALAFVLELLDGLAETLRKQAQDAVALRRAFLNQGESLHQNARTLTEAGVDVALLQETSARLRELGNRFSPRRFGLLAPPPPDATDLDEAQRALQQLRHEWLRAARAQQ